MLSAVNQYGKIDYAFSASHDLPRQHADFRAGPRRPLPLRRDPALLPVGELFTFGKEDDIIDRVAHLVMPAMILGLANAAPLMRYTRASMLEVLSSEYITTARSKGMREPTVMIRHGLRNALIPIITLIAILLPQLIAGAVITESVFNWPGLGQLSVQRRA